MNRTARRRLAKDHAIRIGAAPGAAPGGGATETLQQNLQLGMTHHQAGRLEQVTESYQGILARQPDHADANHLLGVVAFQRGRGEDSLRLISRAIELNPTVAAYHINLGVPLRMLGRLDDSAASYRQAISLSPDNSEAYFNLGNVLHRQGLPEQAIASFQQAVAHRPDYAAAHHNLGLAYHQSGAVGEAVAALRDAVRFDPRNDSHGEDLAEALSKVCFAEIDDRLLADLLLLLERPVVRADKISLAIISALRHQPDIAALLADHRTAAGDGGAGGYHAVAERLSRIPLLLRIMALSVLNDLAFERMLSGLRHVMLRAEGEGRGEGQGEDQGEGASLPFSAALAIQCFTNEYAYRETASESAAVETLRRRLETAVADGGDIAPRSLVALAAYRPLHDFPWAEGLAERPWPEPLMALVERQLSEPLAERSLAASIPSLTPIEDEVSLAVRDQHEENPYPRWVKAGLADEAQPIGHHLRATVLNPDVGDYESPSSPEILVAGCGTGQHALATATRYLDATVLAVDLSRASLAYALRKTRELGVGNIEYRQGDILELAALDRRFDLIECAGVLHHMADPLAGWRVLSELLRPGGLMFIALYSEAARKPVVTIREMIARKGYAASPEDIRRCRWDIMEAARGGDAEMARIVGWRDFYSLSGCRDLLFHVAEHRFTIPMVEDALRRLDLEFLGFSMFSDISRLLRFKQTHDDDAFTSLAQWHAFEAENPDTFSAMYQFWVRKPG
jgi:tetratricopeptide (TPR) repeat protein/SAM-dependent methyltransferase